MQLSKFDIGAEILAILTKGMYPDPRDAVREYIQNSIDAKAANVSVKVRQNSVVIEDDGVGMDYSTLRKAVRLGVSDKRPGKDVGFMGIGIYSAFHLCDNLTIFTRKKGLLPQSLAMDFKGMRTLLEEQKEKRLNGEITSEDLTDLQTLLQTYIQMPDEGKVEASEYPIEKGTRIEIVGLNPILDDFLNKFEDLAGYLRDVVPLRFDKDNFKWAELIENKVEQVCETHNAHFELINLKLQVGSKIENLYRPYKDTEFNNNTPQEPKFKELEANGVFLGIAWGCLNSYDKSKTRIANKDLRGFLLKKQGFSIGKRENLAKYFSQSNTHFDRYTGEIIVVNNQILPNAARNDFEASPLRAMLYMAIQKDLKVYYNGIGDKYQEDEKAKEVLTSQGNSFKQVLAEYNPNEDNPHTLIKWIGQIKEVQNALSKKRLSNLYGDDKKDAQNIISASEKLNREILLRFDLLTSKKKAKKPNIQSKDVKTELADSVQDFTADEVSQKFETLLDLVNHLEIDYTEEMKQLIELIDTRFIQSMATTKTNYFQLLLDLKSDFENQ
jgi:Histidine kinase-, DNA gyrase B-, and HSP90-like ATPase